jgi:histidinol-phosphate aminotransferase
MKIAMEIEYGKTHLHALPLYVPRALEAITSCHSANENPLGPSPRAIAAIREAASSIHRYPDAGSLALRRALARKLDLECEALAVTNGSDEMIALLCQALVGKGTSVLMAAGSFITFAVRAAAAEARVLAVPLRDQRHDLAAMAAAMESDTRLIFVCNPNNPTGTTNGGTEIAEFLQRIPRRIIVVVDEAYGDFVAPGSGYPDLLQEVRGGRRNLVVLRTFAKAYGLAGLRIGYAIGNPELLAYIQKLRPIFSVNALAQTAALAALKDDAHLRATIEYAQKWRAVFTERFNAAGLPAVASQANFTMVRVGNDAAAADYLAARGFSVTPLSAWGLPGYLRLSFSTPLANEQLLSALCSWATQFS